MYSKKFFIDFPSVLLICLPLLLITGPLLSDLAVSLISLIYIFHIIIKKDFKIFKNRWFQFLIIFWIYLILNSLINTINFDSLRISVSYLRFIFFIFAISFLLSAKNDNLKYFFYCLLSCYLLLIFDSLIQFFFKENLLGFPLIPGPRLSSFFGDELILGSYLARLFPLLLGIFILINGKKNSKFLNYLLIFIFILCGFIIFLTGERTAFFYFILVNFFLAIALRTYKKLKIYCFSISLLAIVLSVIFNPGLKDRMVDLTLLELFPVVDGKKKIVIFTDQHTQHYKSAIKIYKDNSLLGIGVKNFRLVCKEPKYEISEISCSTHPHHTYIQLLTEVGVIGFSFIVFIFFYFLKFIINILRVKNLSNIFILDTQLCLISCIIISLWPLSPSGNFFNNWLSIVYYLPAGFILYSLKLKKI